MSTIRQVQAEAQKYLMPAKFLCFLDALEAEEKGALEELEAFVSRELGEARAKHDGGWVEHGIDGFGNRVLLKLRELRGGRG